MKITTKTLLLVLSVLMYTGCKNDQTKRKTFTLTLVTDHNLETQKEGENKLPEELLKILEPVDAVCATSKEENFWKAEANLVRIDFQSAIRQRITPDFSKNLTPEKDKDVYIRGLNTISLADSFFIPATDSANSPRKLANQLPLIAKHSPYIINFGENDIWLNDSVSVKAINNIAQLKDSIKSYLCKKTAGQSIMLFYRVSIDKPTGNADMVPQPIPSPAPCPPKGAQTGRDTQIYNSRYKILHDGKCGIILLQVGNSQPIPAPAPTPTPTPTPIRRSQPRQVKIPAPPSDLDKTTMEDAKNGRIKGKDKENIKNN